MVFNQDTISGKWDELKGEVRKKWGELTEDEVTKTQGNVESLLGLVQQRYGIAKEKAREDFNAFVTGWQEKTADKANTTIDSAKAKLKSNPDMQ